MAILPGLFIGDDRPLFIYPLFALFLSKHCDARGCTDGGQVFISHSALFEFAK